jgi:uncharacterized protein YdhG (YjbR/CyaY superfamily)
MVQTKSKPMTIDLYIDRAPKEAQGKLREIYACLRKAIPGAKKDLKWGMPAFSYNRILLTFAGFKHHIGFYPTPSAVVAFAKELTAFKTAKGSIQFPLDEPLPTKLISRIAKFRVKESIEQDKKWKS